MTAVSMRSVTALRRAGTTFALPSATVQRRHISPPTHRPSQAVGTQLKLSDGRTLGYHTSGRRDGKPVLYIHGNPDSGIQVTGTLETKVANKLGIRWIGPDRPGIGLSSKHTRAMGCAITTYPEDIQSLVDHLGLEELYIIGTSGGTGYTLALAKFLSPHQLKGVGICAGIGPVECGFNSMSPLIKTAWDMWRDHPQEMQKYIADTYVRISRDRDPRALRASMEEAFRSYLSGEDLEHVLQDDAFEVAVRGYRQIYAQGAGAHARGIEVNLRSWGYRVEDVGFEGIRLWYGSDDVNTTPVMGKYMADRLPGAVYKEYEGKSHITIWNEENLEEMLRDLIGQSD